tara:strand:- start:2251 stop:2472 length:222 start_codon:yes stop_codon:yes gene_type:complete
MDIEENIKQRIDLLEERIILTNNERELITFQIKELSEQFYLQGVVNPFYCYCYDVKARDDKCKQVCDDCKVYN